MSTQSLAAELQQMILQGKSMEAFEKFYDDNVVMQEASGEQRKGKEANRKFEQEFTGSIQEFHGAQIKSSAVNEQTGTSFAEWWMDVTFKGGQRVQMEEVSVQHWKNGKVVFERFYYKP